MVPARLVERRLTKHAYAHAAHRVVPSPVHRRQGASQAAVGAKAPRPLPAAASSSSAGRGSATPAAEADLAHAHLHRGPDNKFERENPTHAKSVGRKNFGAKARVSM